MQISAWIRGLRVLAAGTVLATAVLGCENDPVEVAQFFREGPPDAEVITDFETIYSDSAVVKVRIRGPRMLRYEKDGEFVQEFPEGAEIEFFDPDGRVSSTLASKYGIRYDDQERVVVRDSVVWRSLETGDQLDTEELTWLEHEQRIFSDRYVRVVQADKIITGVGFESTQDFSESSVRAIQGVIRRP